MFLCGWGLLGPTDGWSLPSPWVSAAEGRGRGSVWTLPLGCSCPAPVLPPHVLLSQPEVFPCPCGAQLVLLLPPAPFSEGEKLLFPPFQQCKFTCCENFASCPSGSVPAKCKMRRGSKRSISGAVLLCWGEHEAAEHPFRAQHTSRTACSALGRLLLPSQGHELPPGPGAIAVNEPCAQHR